MPFHMVQKVMFHHCDPAGIVFYPRYFEMANIAVETWFADRLGAPFESLHGPMGLGVPTVALEVEFQAPSFHGDPLDFTLTPLKIGRSSLLLSTVAECGGERRLTMTSTLVLAETKGGGSQPWPEALREAITRDSHPEDAA